MDLIKLVYSKISHINAYLAALCLMYLAQGIWFAIAWRWSGGVRRPVFRKLLRWLLAAAGLVLLSTGAAPLVRFFPHRGFAHWVLTAARVWLFAALLGLLGVIAVRLTAWLAGKAVPALRGPCPGKSLERSRRNFLRYCVFLAGAAPFPALAYGFFSRLNYHVRRSDIPVADLPEKLDGLKIVQLSDIHIGDFMSRAEVRRAVEMANRLDADLAVVTGDFITWKGDPLEDCISELGRLRAPLGVWGCNGNHEGHARVEHLAQELFHRNGMRLLRKQNEVLEFQGEKINIIGVDYQREKGLSGYTHMLEGVEPLVRGDMPNILLSHNPNSFYRAAGMGIELSLAGHTHGGQISIGIDGEELSPALFYTKFVAGMYTLPFKGEGEREAGRPGTVKLKPCRAERGQSAQERAGHGAAALYVNRGLGTIWLPVRLDMPPEITLLTLRRAV